MAAHGHGLRGTARLVSRTCHRSSAAPASNKAEIGKLSCCAEGKPHHASQPLAAWRCGPASNRTAGLRRAKRNGPSPERHRAPSW